MIAGIFIENMYDDRMFHILDWYITKKRRVRHSSYGEEILTYADADDRRFYLKDCIKYVTEGKDIQKVLIVESKGLYDTISTLHNGRKYRLRQTLQCIRDIFE